MGDAFLFEWTILFYLLGLTGLKGAIKRNVLIFTILTYNNNIYIQETLVTTVIDKQLTIPFRVICEILYKHLYKKENFHLKFCQ